MKHLISLAILLVSTSAFATVVQPVGAASQVLVPAAGSTPGANGTFFHSDISIINFASHDQTVAIQWLPQAGTGATGSTTVITIPALSGVRASDFVSQYLNQTGLGSLIITGAANSNGTGIDTSARLYVSSRIWTLQPNTNGTVSQTFPAIPLSTVNTPIAGLFAVSSSDNPSNYRVNAGIVNVDPTLTQTFAINVAGSSTITTVTLPPMTMTQVSLGNNISPTAQISVQNASAIRSNLWTAYSSTVDNITGDAWSELAVVGTTP